MYIANSTSTPIKYPDINEDDIKKMKNLGYYTYTDDYFITITSGIKDGYVFKQEHFKLKKILVYIILQKRDMK